MAYDHQDIVFNLHPLTIGEGDGKITLTCADKAVLSVLAYRADKETHECYPSYRDIAAKSVLSRRQAIESVARLTKLGALTSSKGKDGSRQSNVYTLNVDRLNELVELSQSNGSRPPRRTYNRTGKYKGKGKLAGRTFTDTQKGRSTTPLTMEEVEFLYGDTAPDYFHPLPGGGAMVACNHCDAVLPRGSEKHHMTVCPSLPPPPDDYDEASSSHFRPGVSLAPYPEEKVQQ